MKTNVASAESGQPRTLFIALLMVIIVLCQPWGSLAQDASVEIQAQRDAEKDLNSAKELTWFVAGCCGGVFPFVILTTLAFGEDISYIGPMPLDTCLISVFGVGLLLPTGYAALHSPAPPTNQFLGKSSDYVDAYTVVYRNRMKRKRVVQSTKGCLLGTCLSGSLIITAIIVFNDIGAPTAD